MSNEGEAMSLPTYEIFKKEQTDFTWVGAVQELESAKERIKELSGHSDAEFVVFDQRTMKVVANFTPPLGPD
jgi:hypothetical protein